LKFDIYEIDNVLIMFNLKLENQNKISDIFKYLIINHATNKSFKSPKLDINNAVATVKSFKYFIEAQLDAFSVFE
jgi:hypothetical protein